jgi:hypothetical protein
VGNYCLDCFILVRSDANNAIKKLRSCGIKPNNIKPPTNEEFNKAFDNLIGFNKSEVSNDQ